MTAILFQGLGEFAVQADRVPVLLGSPRRRTLLAALLAAANETVAAASLIAELWPAGPPQNALANLRTYASELRRQLPAEIAARISTRNGGYRLRVRPEEFDVWRLRRQHLIARTALDDGDPAAAVSALEPFQPDLAAGAPFGGVAGGPLLEALRAGVAEEARTARETYFEACLGAAASPEVISALRSHVHRHPLGEHGHVLLMTALAQTGQNAAALEAYHQARELLVTELGIEPGRELQDTQQSVLRGEVTPAVSPTHPAPRTLPGGGAQPGFRPFQLPPDLPDFAGRRETVKDLAGLLSGGSGGAWPAVASITGMPGTGKSSLAVHVAHQVRGEYPDGQVYLDLAGGELGAVDPYAALGQVLAGLGLTAGAMPATAQERAAALRSMCADRRILLVLDNVQTAGHMLPMLPASASCGLLVTSRAPLAGLQAWPQVELTPLGHRDGVELLTGIVGQGRVRAEPDAAARVVELCGGLPLAIRIAGTRLAVCDHQTLRWLAARLDDEQTRLDELAVGELAVRRSFDVAFQALDPQRQRGLRILAQLAVPDFGAWLAAAAFGSTVREAEDIIDDLVRVRLLSAVPGRGLDEPRYRFHQLVRLYARDLTRPGELAGDIAAAVARAYGACLAAAAHMDQRLHRHTPLVTSDRPAPAVLPPSDGTEPAAWFANEQATLVAAVHGAAAQGLTDLSWDLALTLQRYLETHHHLPDWLDVAAAGLAAAQHSGHRLAQAAMQCSRGEACMVQDDLDGADQAYRAVLALTTGQALITEPAASTGPAASGCSVAADRGPGAPRGESGRALSEGARRARAWALLGLSGVYSAQGQLSLAADTARQSVDLVSGQPDQGIEAEAWMSLGAIQHLQGHLGAASASFERALAGFTATGDQMNQAILLVNMGTTNSAAGRLAEAERCYQEAARLCQQIGFRNGEAFAYTGLGRMLHGRGDRARAEQVLLKALAIVRDYADTCTESKIMINLGELHRADDLSRSRECFSRAVALLSPGQLPRMLADALAGLGETEATGGDLGAARRAWNQAALLLSAIDARRAEALRERAAASA